ncbi:MULTISPECIES: GntR family transcriptional regulator [unclassified Microbacterium]|uniref:GntR family transcriptional regulator n=1 Tax=unclassified Microbacterium TaxID=2609290 RepID=UPI0034420E73
MNNNRSTTGVRESKQLLAEEVFRHIGSQIVDGRLGPGHRIRDVDVAEELHVSRTPVREALQRLERLGLVVMYPSRYTEVTTVTPEIVEQTLEFAGYQAGMAARMGVERMSHRDRERAAALVEELYDEHDDLRVFDIRWTVFTFLSDHSRNIQHQILLTDASMALARNLRHWKVPASERERMHDIYRDFHDAILRGDAGDAERLARAMHGV